MKTMPYPVRLPKHLLELADLRAEDEQVDRSTALRQLLYAGATGYVLELLRKGRISVSNYTDARVGLPRHESECAVPLVSSDEDSTVLTGTFEEGGI